MGIMEAINNMKMAINAIRIMFIILIIQNICTSVFLLCHHLDIAKQLQAPAQAQEYIYKGQNLPPMEELEYPD